MTEFKQVANVNDLSPGQGSVVNVEDKEIALFNVEGDFYAVDNACTHRDGPLGEGRLGGTTVTCPWHGAQFDVTSGEALALPAPADVESYPTKIENGSVWVKLAE